MAESTLAYPRPAYQNPPGLKSAASDFGSWLALLTRTLSLFGIGW